MHVAYSTASLSTLSNFGEMALDPEERKIYRGEVDWKCINIGNGI
jgi:hypothetical protein